MGANAQTSVPAFTSGQVLTAAQVNNINTGIPVFASSTERDAAFGGSGEKTLAEGQYAFLEDTNETLVYDGSSWGAVAGGKILQVVSTTKTDTFSATVSAGSGSAITGLTASITPSSTGSKVLAFVMVSGMSDNSELALSLTRGGTAIAQPASPGSRTPATSSTSGAGGTNSQIHATITYLDSPASVSALTYGVDFMNARSVSTVVYVNRSKDDTDNNDHVRSVSSITLMEVSA